MSVQPSVVTRAPVPAARADGVRVPDPDRRFYAFAVDRLIGWGIDLAVALLAVHFLVARGHTLEGILVIVLTVLVVGAVFALLAGTTGRTPGKGLLGLRLVHTGTGEPIGVGPSLLRTFVLGVAAVPFGFGLAALAWTALADVTRMRRGWHDHLVSSVVVDTRPVPVPEEPEDAGPRHVVNLTAMRLMPPGRAAAELAPTSLPARAAPAGRPRHAATEPTVRAPLTATIWQLVFDTGERVVVDSLVLIGRNPEPTTGERGARLVALPSADRSVSAIHAQVVVAPDGALVVTDRHSTNGTTLVRQGLPRTLTPGRGATLVAGDVVHFGDRTMTVVRFA
jgi:uncharacterized RDD family membrane protein YckC